MNDVGEINLIPRQSTFNKRWVYNYNRKKLFASY